MRYFCITLFRYKNVMKHIKNVVISTPSEDFTLEKAEKQAVPHLMEMYKLSKEYSWSDKTEKQAVLDFRDAVHRKYSLRSESFGILIFELNMED